jgi:antitoxin HicB
MWFELKLDIDDNDTFLVTAPMFPEVTTYGDNEDEALSNGRDAIEEAIAARITNADPIPFPLKNTPGKGRFVELPLLTFLKAGLYMSCLAQSVSRAELARRLKWHREQVDRLFRLDHNSRVDQLEQAFRAINVPLRLYIPALDNAA